MHHCFGGMGDLQFGVLVDDGRVLGSVSVL